MAQKSEEACKQYRKWLGALADYSRAALLGREAVKEAMKAAEAENSAREEELGLFLAEADAFLSSQRSHRSGRRRRSERWVWIVEGHMSHLLSIEFRL